jgi:hypothetical protein
MESIRVERAIKRVRFDLVAHLKRPSADITGPVSISTSLGKDDGDTVIFSATASSPLALEPSPTTEAAGEPMQEEISPPSKVTQETPTEHTIPENFAAEVAKPKDIPEGPMSKVSTPNSKDDEDATPVAMRHYTNPAITTS